MIYNFLPGQEKRVRKCEKGTVDCCDELCIVSSVYLLVLGHPSVLVQSRNGEVVDEEPLITHRVEEDDMLAAQTESTESEIRKKLPTFKVPPPCSDGKETTASVFLDC